MVAKFIGKTEDNGWCQRKARFQKALRLMENDICNDMLCGKNKVTSLDCSFKLFLIPNSARAMTVIPHL